MLSAGSSSPEGTSTTQPQRPAVAPSGTGWVEQAACQGLDVRLFYPDGGNRSGRARRVCAGCLVRASCLEHALTTNERWGVWGGKSEDERRAMRRQRRGAAS